MSGPPAEATTACPRCRNFLSWNGQGLYCSCCGEGETK